MNRKLILLTVVLICIVTACNSLIPIKRYVYDEKPPEEKGDVTISGTLICLNCFFVQSDESRNFCAENGHQHVLRAVDGRMYTIIRDEKTLELVQSGKWNNKAVTVTGRIIENSRAIKVSTFEVF